VTSHGIYKLEAKTTGSDLIYLECHPDMVMVHTNQMEIEMTIELLYHGISFWQSVVDSSIFLSDPDPRILTPEPRIRDPTWTF
jgi:hypothetical protein